MGKTEIVTFISGSDIDEKNKKASDICEGKKTLHIEKLGQPELVTIATTSPDVVVMKNLTSRQVNSLHNVFYQRRIVVQLPNSIMPVSFKRPEMVVTIDGFLGSDVKASRHINFIQL